MCGVWSFGVITSSCALYFSHNFVILMKQKLICLFGIMNLSTHNMYKHIVTWIMFLGRGFTLGTQHTFVGYLALV